MELLVNKLGIINPTYKELVYTLDMYYSELQYSPNQVENKMVGKYYFGVTSIRDEIPLKDFAVLLNECV